MRAGLAQRGELPIQELRIVRWRVDEGRLLSYMRSNVSQTLLDIKHVKHTTSSLTLYVLNRGMALLIGTGSTSPKLCLLANRNIDLEEVRERMKCSRACYFTHLP